MARKIMEELERLHALECRLGVEELYLELGTPSPTGSLPLMEKIKIHEKLWTMARDVVRCTPAWTYGPLLEIPAEACERSCATWRTTLKQLEMGLRDDSPQRGALAALRAQCDDFLQFSPVVRCLCSPAVRER